MFTTVPINTLLNSELAELRRLLVEWATASGSKCDSRLMARAPTQSRGLWYNIVAYNWI